MSYARELRYGCAYLPYIRHNVFGWCCAMLCEVLRAGVLQAFWLLLGLIRWKWKGVSSVGLRFWGRTTLDPKERDGRGCTAPVRSGAHG
jgi:hypothetical protein